MPRNAKLKYIMENDDEDFGNVPEAARFYGNYGIDPVVAARNGDFGPMAWWVRSGQPMGKIARDLVADIIEGKFRRPKHRPSDSVIDLRVAEDVVLLELEGTKTEAAVSQVGERYSMSRRRIIKALERCRVEVEYTIWPAFEKGYILLPNCAEAKCFSEGYDGHRCQVHGSSD